MAELFERFPADASAERWWADQRWPEGLRCAHDERADVSTDTGLPSGPCRGRTCRRCFSAQIGTVMYGSNRGYRKWAIAIYRPHPGPRVPGPAGGPLKPPRPAWAPGSRTSMRPRARVPVAARWAKPRCWDYGTAPRPGCRSQVNHGQGEYGRGPVHTNGMEAFWVLFDRGYMGAPTTP